MRRPAVPTIKRTCHQYFCPSKSVASMQGLTLPLEKRTLPTFWQKALTSSILKRNLKILFKSYKTLISLTLVLPNL
jgi:hypothetical protein